MEHCYYTLHAGEHWTLFKHFSGPANLSRIGSSCSHCCTSWCDYIPGHWHSSGSSYLLLLLNSQMETRASTAASSLNVSPLVNWMCLMTTSISTHSAVPGQAVIRMTENIVYHSGGDGIAPVRNAAYASIEDHHFYEELPGCFPDNKPEEAEEKGEERVGEGSGQDGEYYVNDDLLLPGKVAGGGGKEMTEGAKKKHVASDDGKEVKKYDEYYVNDDLFPASGGDMEQSSNSKLEKEEDKGKSEEEEEDVNEHKGDTADISDENGYLKIEG